MGCMYQLHPYHLVKSSPWPLSLSMSLLFLALSFVGSLQSLPFFLTCLSCLYSFSVICLWRLDIIIESTYVGSHTLRVRSGLTIGWFVFLFVFLGILPFLALARPRNWWVVAASWHH